MFSFIVGTACLAFSGYLGLSWLLDQFRPTVRDEQTMEQLGRMVGFGSIRKVI